MTFKLRKPPIAEIWIGFAFNAPAGSRGWDETPEDVVAKFLRECGAGFSKPEVLYEDEVSVSKRDKSGLPTEFTGRMRKEFVAFDEVNRTAIRVGFGDVAVHHYTAKSEYPGFRSILRDALSVAEAFAAKFGTRQVRLLEMHIIDIVSIPFDENRRVELGKYLKAIPEFPDSFGPVNDFLFQTSHAGLTSNDRLRLSIRPAPKPVPDKYASFIIQWDFSFHHADEPLGVEATRVRLEAGYDFLKRRFRELFTEAGWSLFDPE